MNWIKKMSKKNKNIDPERFLQWVIIILILLIILTS